MSTDLANRNEIARANAANSKLLNQYQTDTTSYQNALSAWQAKNDPTSAAPAPPTRPTLESPRLLNNTITRGLMTNLPATLQNPAGALALSILNAGYLLDVELSAIQEQGRGEVISNPRIVTSNQKEAVIRQGKEIGYLTVSGGQGGNVPTVQFKEAPVSYTHLDVYKRQQPHHRVAPALWRFFRSTTGRFRRALRRGKRKEKEEIDQRHCQ